VLVLLDAALTSTGLSYFNFVEPRVKRFQSSLAAGLTLWKLPPLLEEKNWFCVSNRCRDVLLSGVRSFSTPGDELRDEWESMKEWAASANPFSKTDPFSSTKGVGTFTVQYLRGQLGFDVPIPDRVVAGFLSKVLARNLKKEREVMAAIQEVASQLGLSNLELVWSIWIYADSKTPRRPKTRDKRLGFKGLKCQPRWVVIKAPSRVTTKVCSA